MRLRVLVAIALLLFTGGLLAPPAEAVQPAYRYTTGPTFSSWPVWIGSQPTSTSYDALLYVAGTPTGIEYSLYSSSTLPSLFAGNLAAKVVQPTILTVATLPTCNAALFGAIASITDGAGATDCTTGASTTDVACECNGSAWAARYTGAADTSAYVLKTAAAQQSVTASGAGNDVTLTASDDVILAPTDALTGTVGGAVAITTTAGAITLTAGGTTQDISLVSVDQVVIDGAGGDDELVIDDDEVLVAATAAFRVAIASAPPVACASGTKATLYYDSDINKMCICNGTNYVLMNDDSTTTGCS